MFYFGYTVYGDRDKIFVGSNESLEEIKGYIARDFLRQCFAKDKRPTGFEIWKTCPSCEGNKSVKFYLSKSRVETACLTCYGAGKVKFI